MPIRSHITLLSSIPWHCGLVVCVGCILHCAVVVRSFLSAPFRSLALGTFPFNSAFSPHSAVILVTRTTRRRRPTYLSLSPHLRARSVVCTFSRFLSLCFYRPVLRITVADDIIHVGIDGPSPLWEQFTRSVNGQGALLRFDACSHMQYPMGKHPKKEACQGSQEERH